jgi:hypothetical protein
MVEEAKERRNSNGKEVESRATTEVELLFGAVSGQKQ